MDSNLLATGDFTPIPGSHGALAITTFLPLGAVEVDDIVIGLNGVSEDGSARVGC